MRTCPKCKWQYPSTYNYVKCKYCDTMFDEQRCTMCKQLVPTYKFYKRSDGRLTRRCPDCNRKDSREWDANNKEAKAARNHRMMEKHMVAAEMALYNWLDKSGDITFKSMKEDEWLEACRYFGGCAICGNEHIETRHFFIPFEEGGKYTAWNMIPLCGPCAAAIPKSIKNPFSWFNKYLGNATALGLNEDRKHKIVTYLTKKMKEAID